MYITKQMIELWIGSDNMSADKLLELLTEIINGQYHADEFRKDVLEFQEDNNEM